MGNFGGDSTGESQDSLDERNVIPSRQAAPQGGEKEANNGATSLSDV